MPTFDKVNINQMNYGIILNDLDMNMEFPITIGSWQIHKATVTEITEFRKEFHKFKAAASINAPLQEMKITELPRGGRNYKHIPNPNDYRYTLIKPINNESAIGSKISEALRISDCDLWTEIWCITNKDNERKVGGSPGPCVRYLLVHENYINPPSIDPGHLNEVVTLRESFNDEEFPAISRAIEMFRAQDVTGENHLKHLGYFSLIESILSHAPKPNDSADSISRQLKRNLILLNNRMPTDRNFNIEKFNGTNPEKVIGKLYSYRSTIAHGNTSETEFNWLYENRPFNTGNQTERFYRMKWISSYLRLIVRRVLVQALREPQLITDLKG